MPSSSSDPDALADESLEATSLSLDPSDEETICFDSGILAGTLDATASEALRLPFLFAEDDSAAEGTFEDTDDRTVLLGDFDATLPVLAGGLFEAVGLTGFADSEPDAGAGDDLAGSDKGVPVELLNFGLV